MRGLMILVLAFVVSPAFANKEYPANYWEKGYATSGVPAIYYNLSIQVKDLAKAAAEADRRITKIGGSLTSMNSQGPDGNGRQTRTMNYAIDLKNAEATAKSFFDMGDLISYSSSRNAGQRDGDEISDKLKEITAERDENAACLAKMPIASYFLNGKIAQLKQSLATFEDGGAKASLALNLIVEPKTKK